MPQEPRSTVLLFVQDLDLPLLCWVGEKYRVRLTVGVCGLGRPVDPGKALFRVLVLFTLAKYPGGLHPHNMTIVGTLGVAQTRSPLFQPKHQATEWQCVRFVLR